MMPRQAPPSQEKTWNTLPDRIERLKLVKVCLLDEWSQAMKQAYRAPLSDRHDVLQVVEKRYSDLVDVVESHIMTLKASTNEFSPRIERLLLRTGR